MTTTTLKAARNAALATADAALTACQANPTVATRYEYGQAFDAYMVANGAYLAAAYPYKPKA